MPFTTLANRFNRRRGVETPQELPPWQTEMRPQILPGEEPSPLRPFIKSPGGLRGQPSFQAQSQRPNPASSANLSRSGGGPATEALARLQTSEEPQRVETPAGTSSQVADEETLRAQGGAAPSMPENSYTETGKGRAQQALDSLGGFPGITTYASLGRKGVMPIRPPEPNPEAIGPATQAKIDLERSRIDKQGEVTPALQATLEQRDRESGARIEASGGAQRALDEYRAATLKQGDERIGAMKENRAAVLGNKTEAENKGIVTDYMKRPDVSKSIGTSTFIPKVQTLLDNPNPQNDQAVFNYLPRLLGEVGNLSASDRAMAQRRMGWLNQLEDWSHQGMTGEISPERRQQLRELAGFIGEANNTALDEAADVHAQQYGGASGIYHDRTPEQVRNMIRPGKAAAPTGGGAVPGYNFPPGQEAAYQQALKDWEAKNAGPQR